MAVGAAEPDLQVETTPLRDEETAIGKTPLAPPVFWGFALPALVGRSPFACSAIKTERRDRQYPGSLPFVTECSLLLVLPYRSISHRYYHRCLDLMNPGHSGMALVVTAALTGTMRNNMLHIFYEWAQHRMASHTIYANPARAIAWSAVLRHFPSPQWRRPQQQRQAAPFRFPE